MTALKGLGILLLLFLVFAIQSHFRRMKIVRFYMDRGVKPIPGYDRFFIGNIPNFARAAIAHDEAKASKGKFYHFL